MAALASASGAGLDELGRRFGARGREALSRLDDHEICRRDVRQWDFDTLPDEFRGPCKADVVENDVIDVDDLIELILRWDETGPYGGFIRADVDRDGDVDVDDLLALILAWGPCPCGRLSGCAW